MAKGHYQGPATSQAQFKYLWASGLAPTFKHNWVPRGLYHSLPGYAGGGKGPNSGKKPTYGHKMGTGRKTGFHSTAKGTAARIAKRATTTHSRMKHRSKI